MGTESGTAGAGRAGFAHVPGGPVVLTGGEELGGTGGGTVLDFWRYALPDLRTNTTRGLLAEYLVHRAVGARARNEEWASFDVLSPDGLRIEVKTSAYLQSWGQARHSRITFSRLRGRTWSPEEGSSDGPTYNADVYVFALHTALDHADYDPLDVGLWQFHVTDLAAVASSGRASLGLATVRRICGPPVGYDRLAAAIAEAGRRSPEPAVPQPEDGGSGRGSGPGRS
ncbi:hypothetical protein CFP65_3012 [Kitasatospora sp. MMS16-BH015]|uniref:hypothetical protein n=1 Tax=Kitasatospora sp. MMS16-BH015 TaxID=2018025 RepID=UPI000CA1A12B|nr:hypothetical protein [Kitasatospora sp. MMS16-BH015]AUG77822.1 hypothetical protein CFP65_3012 [Kitasatospora sp. MMS16-BH015]